MAGVDWSDIGGNQGAQSSKKNIYLKLEADRNYRIRPLSKPISLWTYYIRGNDGKVRRAITSTANDKPDCIIAKKHGETPKQRYVVNCLLRNEDGSVELKVLEAPLSVFRPMRQWQEATGNLPGAVAEGGDFVVKKVSPPDGNPINTRYEVASLGQTPLTDDEKKMIQERGLFNLEEMYPVTSQDEIESVLYPDAQPTVTSSAGASSSGSDVDDLSF